MSDLEWMDGNRIRVAAPKKPLKITGTRFAAICGLNKWNTEFKTWCEITRTYKEPFEDTIYTIAGKTIEPKQAEFMKRSYAMTDLVTPSDMFGEDYFQKTMGDFFQDVSILGGMWDYLTDDAVLEMKTTKRVEDWVDDIPEYYALQAALYAWLLKRDNVIMVCSFLSDADYEHPDEFVPTPANTIVRPFKVSERYPDMDERVGYAVDWWNCHVITGLSPVYDEKADEDILKALRTANVDPNNTDAASILSELDDIQQELDRHAAATKDLEKRAKALKEGLKKFVTADLIDHDKAVADSQHYVWTVAKVATTTYDEDRMKADGVYELYHSKPSVTIKVTNKMKKE